MFYKVDFDIRTFKFWAGAKDRMDDATDEQIKKVEQRIFEFYDCGGFIPTETQINDLVWFDCDDIFYPEDYDEDDNDQ